MKFAFIFLSIIISIVVARPVWEGHVEGVHIPLPETDFVFDTNAYDPAHVYSNAFGNFGNYWIADDFTPSYSGQITVLTFWTVSTTTNPTGLEATIYGDGYPGPGTILWQNLVSDIIWANSGVTFAGYPIYICFIDLPNLDYPNIWAGTTYWVTAHREDGENLYAIVDDEVSGSESYRILAGGGDWVPGSSTGYDPVDMFRIIEGTVALDRATWGMVKTLFQ